MNYSIRRHEGGALSRRVFWLKALAFVGLGALFMILYLVPGCGSDSKPGEVAAKKKETTAANAKAMKPQGIVPLLVVEEKARGAGGKMADVKKPLDQNTMVLPDITREEMLAKNAVAVKWAESPGIEILPGVTKEEMEAKNAAAVKWAESPGIEVMPGVTLEEIRAKNAAAVKWAESPGIEVMPGITKEEMQARQTAALQTPLPSIMENMPGLTKKTANIPAK